MQENPSSIGTAVAQEWPEKDHASIGTGIRGSGRGVGSGRGFAGAGAGVGSGAPMGASRPRTVCTARSPSRVTSRGGGRGCTRPDGARDALGPGTLGIESENGEGVMDEDYGTPGDCAHR